jgi:deoxyribodipyrimidine photolyase-related protein
LAHARPGRGSSGGALVLVLGDQLDRRSPVLARLDRTRDGVLIVEAPEESTHVWSHKARIALFFSAMRHFGEDLRRDGVPLSYLAIGTHPHASLEAAWRAEIAARAPARVSCVEPGDWRVLEMLQRVCGEAGVALEIVPDPHFLCGRDDFERWAGTRRSLRMEFFYRWMRQRTGVLMDDGKPVGGRWNYDAENRKGFGASGPGAIPSPPRFAPDATTAGAIADVLRHFPAHPGSLASFAWPVTPADARRALDAFVRERLPRFGRFQDAMWTGVPFGWHSLLSAAMNLKLLDPRDVVAAAERAYRTGGAELASVEGFVRQVLGWREFVRGVYWSTMPALAGSNHFGHDRLLPRWYWTGETRMNCLREAIGQTLAHGYAHHIQRLMITGNFALLAGLSPQAVCDWYLAVYVDAVDWVERPNTAGMALYADGGRFTSKPYAASGQYVKRMSNYCAGCRYDPARRAGDAACPLTVLFWNFVLEHESALAAEPRTALMAGNARRIDQAERRRIRDDARRLLAGIETL